MNVTLEMSDELAGLLHDVEPDDSRAIMVETVCGLYSRHRVSSGKAARLLGLDRFGFQQELTKREIPMHYTLEELKHDVAFARGQ